MSTIGKRISPRLNTGSDTVSRKNFPYATRELTALFFKRPQKTRCDWLVGSSGGAAPAAIPGGSGRISRSEVDSVPDSVVSMCSVA